jgi:hypothetical protein
MSLSTQNSSRVIFRLEDLKATITSLVKELRILENEMNNFKSNCDVAKGIGTGLNTIGTVATVSSLFLGPVGFAVAGGIAIGTIVGGTTTNITTSVIDANKSKEVINKIKKIIEKYQDEYRAFEVLAKFLAEKIFIYANENQASFEASMGVIISNNDSLNKFEDTLNSSTFKKMLKNVKPLGNCGQLVAFMCAFVDPNIIHGVGKVCSNIPLFGLNAAGQTCVTVTSAVISAADDVTQVAVQSTSRVAVSSVTKVAVGVGCVFQVAEIISTISNMVANHPTIEQIDKVTDQLKSVERHFGLILEEMRTAQNIGFDLLMNFNA